MLNLTIQAGDYFTIGDDIKVIILGGTKNHVRVMVDAPRKYSVVRGNVLERDLDAPEDSGKRKKYYPARALTAEDIRRLAARQNYS